MIMVRYGELGVLKCSGRYDITFARNDCSGVMAPCTVFSRDVLAWFLTEKVRLRQHAVEELLGLIDTQSSGHLGNVPINDEIRLRFGIVAPAESLTTRFIHMVSFHDS